MTTTADTASDRICKMMTEDFPETYDQVVEVIRQLSDDHAEHHIYEIGEHIATAAGTITPNVTSTGATLSFMFFAGYLFREQEYQRAVQHEGEPNAEVIGMDYDRLRKLLGG